MNDGKTSEHFYWNEQKSTVFLYTINPVISMVCDVLEARYAFGHFFGKIQNLRWKN